MADSKHPDYDGVAWRPGPANVMVPVSPTICARWIARLMLGWRGQPAEQPR